MLRGSLLFLLVLFMGHSFAQPGPNQKKDRRERIQAQKIAFISTELDLTPEEAQKFWPMYNLYEADIDEIRKTRRSYMKELRKNRGLSPERSYELFQLIFESEKAESDIRLDYLKRFADLLGKQKAAGVFIAEEKFKRELLDKLNKEGRNPPPPDANGRP